MLRPEEAGNLRTCGILTLGILGAMSLKSFIRSESLSMEYDQAEVCHSSPSKEMVVVLVLVCKLSVDPSIDCEPCRKPQVGPSGCLGCKPCGTYVNGS